MTISMHGIIIKWKVIPKKIIKRSSQHKQWFKEKIAKIKVILVRKTRIWR